ncbi:Ig-like domain-containing protein [Bacillus sp. 3255]|uniref:Ig-like domain-containing protein n=1 Tax=Bacillus sp. 3255 TaxID=2817904 RepID=UPI00285DBB82|nr:Ig-like domain-containing protein [Bacillus sp. 3255]MDR6880642.1 hypothetical protein [Bacillus sp. 3255]
MKKIGSMLLGICIAASLLPSVAAGAELTPAFPGAEGAGMYITGGRGGEVYEVTSLDDYTSKETPIPGTLRYGLMKVANSNAKSTVIVFRVSGTIHLKEKIKTNVYNLTLAGQTAPGGGIAIGNYSVSLGGSNIIMRYLRFRGGFAELDDTFSPNAPKMMIDHCSFSWSTDEVLSSKDKSSITVQWSIISDSLNMSIHDKGAHGYGGIWGGTNMTFHHNLIASNNSRNPRLDRDFRLEKDAPLQFDLRNNVMYNWGANSAYGGENATGVNVVNNYYKAGPATFDDVKNRIFNPWSEQPGNYYVDGNYVAGYPDISANNWAGGIQPEYGLGTVHRLANPVAITYKNTDGTVTDTTVTTDSAEEAYSKVLEHAGAVLPKRDSLDARIVNDVRNGLGKFANTPDGDGGFPELAELTLPADYDSDHDGMPDEWEAAHGLNANDAADGKAVSGIDGSGYTNLENYLNGIVGNGSANPVVAISSPTANARLQENRDIVIEASASDSDGTVASVEFSYYDTRTMKLTPLGSVNSAPYTYTWSNAPEGTHYLYAKATDNTGTQTLSSLVVVHVNGDSGTGAWTSADIGAVTIPGTASLSESDSTFVIKGTGEIGASNDGIHASDAFQYTHRDVTGDMELISTVSLQNPSEYDNGVKAGLMIRQDLSETSPFAMIAVKKEEYYGSRIHFMSRSGQGDLVVSTAKPNVELPALLKITRYGNEIKGYVSVDGGSNWELVGATALDLPEHAYIGMAVDATKSTNNFDYYNSSIFANTKLRTNNLAGDVFSVGDMQVNDDEGETSVSVEFTNQSQLDKNGILVIALYDQDNNIVNYSYSSDLVEGLGARTLTASFQIPQDSASYKLKAFVWDQLASKQVISNVVELP